MKTATVRQIRNQFPSVLGWVKNGETVVITSRRKIVATLTPPPAPAPRKRAWSDLDVRMERLLARPLLPVSGAQLLAGDRDRF